VTSCTEFFLRETWTRPIKLSEGTGNAATEHVQTFAIGDGAEYIRLSPNIPTISTPSLSAVKVFQVSSSREPSNPPLLLTNIFCERLS
jgi:hypothetical protein